MGKTFGEEDRARAGAGRPSGRTDRGRQASEYGALSMRRGEEEEERRGEGRFKSYPRQWVASRQTQTARQVEPSGVEWSPCLPACLLPSLSASPLPSLPPRGRRIATRRPARRRADRPIHPIHSAEGRGGREGESGAKMESAALCATWSVGRSVGRSVGP